MITDNIKELVKQLAAGRTLLLRADGDRDLDCQSNITTDVSMALADELKTAIDAIEAMAGERDRTRADYEAMKAHNKELFGKLSAAELERDRLKELYDAGCKQWNPVYKVILNERDHLKAALTEIRSLGFGAPTYKLGRNIKKAVEIASKALGDAS